MATFNATSNSVGPGYRFTLTAGQSVKVFADVLVERTDTGGVIFGYESNITFEILGTVKGFDNTYGALSLGNDSADSNGHIIVGETGVVDGGIMVSASASTVDNSGTIDHIYFAATSEGTQSILNNSGTISGSAYGVVRQSGASEDVKIVNTGTIEGTSYSFFANSTDAVETIINTGHIESTIKLGAGDDLYDGRGGTMGVGMVQGDDGNDTMLGGDGTESFGGYAGNDTLDGGGGYDLLHGGLGADTLTGGDGDDHFMYYSVKESPKKVGTYDFITDFSQDEGDLIDLSILDANGKEKKNGKFHFIEDDNFSKDNGELRYLVKDGHTFLQGDTNGNGKADIVIEFDGVIAFEKGDFFL